MDVKIRFPLENIEKADLEWPWRQANMAELESSKGLKNASGCSSEPADPGSASSPGPTDPK